MNTTITTTFHQDGQTDLQVTSQITGSEQAPPLEIPSLAASSSVVISDGIGVLNYANLKGIIIKADSLDLTIAFCSDNAGATPIKSVTVYAGNGYEWDINSGVANPLGTTNCLSIKLSTTTNVAGVAQAVVTTTAIHGRSALSS